MESVLGNEIKSLLIKHSLKISVAESLTSGKLQSFLGEVSGISECYKGGITAYSIIEKTKFLNVNVEHAKKVNCVSSRVASEMAKGVCNMFETDIGISTTGYAETYEENKPHAYYAIYYKPKYLSGVIVSENKIEAGNLDRKNFQNLIINIIFLELLKYLHSLSSKS